MEVKQIYDKVSQILEKHILINKQATLIMQSLGYNGFKKMHYCLMKRFQKKQIKLAYKLFDIKGEKLDISQVALTYNVSSLKEHLKSWLEELKYSIKELGTLNKEYFETYGFMCKSIECIVDLMVDLLKYVHKWYNRGEATDWLEMDLFLLDDKIKKHYEEEHARKD